MKNNLQYNGTTVHWHGVRQLHSLEMDGVPGVSQCPIAPGQSYTYRFVATQYGTSWYHSHYSLQYGDGLAGPLTVHGPSSANYDDPKDPFLMTDWIHRSWFQEFQSELNGVPPPATSILLNGQGIHPIGGMLSPTAHERQVAMLAQQGKASDSTLQLRGYEYNSLCS